MATQLVLDGVEGHLWPQSREYVATGKGGHVSSPRLGSPHAAE